MSGSASKFMRLAGENFFWCKGLLTKCFPLLTRVRRYQMARRIMETAFALKLCNDKFGKYLNETHETACFEILDPEDQHVELFDFEEPEMRSVCACAYAYACMRGGNMGYLSAGLCRIGLCVLLLPKCEGEDAPLVLTRSRHDCRFITFSRFPDKDEPEADVCRVQPLFSCVRIPNLFRTPVELFLPIVLLAHGYMTLHSFRTTAPANPSISPSN